MRHERHYTLEQAAAAMDWVGQRVNRARAANQRLMELGPRAREGLAALDGRSGGSYPGAEVARPLVELNRALGELEAVDVVLRDVQRGLIDFPSIREGAEVYLCWLVDDEHTIAFWHPPDAGFAGRRPV